MLLPIKIGGVEPQDPVRARPLKIGDALGKLLVGQAEGCLLGQFRPDKPGEFFQEAMSIHA